MRAEEAAPSSQNSEIRADLRVKFLKAVDLSTEALNGPSFLEPVATRLREIFSEIHGIEEKCRFMLRRNDEFAAEVARYVHIIDTLSGHNILRNTITVLQNKLLDVILILSSKSEGLDDTLTRLRKLTSSLNIVHDDLGFTIKVICGILCEIRGNRQVMRTVPNGRDLLQELIELGEHISATTSFLKVCKSLSSSVRETGLCTPLKCREVMVERERPEREKGSDGFSEAEIRSIIEDASDEGFREEFRLAMLNVFEFRSLLPLVSESLGSVTLPTDLSEALVIVEALSSVACRYFELPKAVTVSSLQAVGFGAAVSRLLDVATACSLPECVTTLCSAANRVMRGARFVEDANGRVGAEEFVFDISDFVVEPVSACFERVEYEGNKSEKMVDMIGVLSEDMGRLRSMEIDFLDAEHDNILHAPSFAGMFKRISCVLMDITHQRGDRAVAGIRESLGDMLLDYRLIVTSVLDIRLASIDHVSCESSALAVKGLLEMFEFFVVLEKLAGVCPVSFSNVVHISYLRTLCEYFGSQNSDFNEFGEFFGGIDILDIDNEKLLSRMTALKELCYMNVRDWNCDDLSAEYNGFKEEVTALLKQSQNVEALLSTISSFFTSSSNDLDIHSEVASVELMLRTVNVEKPSVVPPGIFEFIERMHEMFAWKHIMNRFIVFLEKTETNVVSREDDEAPIKDFEFRKAELGLWGKFSTKFVKSSFRPDVCEPQCYPMRPKFVQDHFNDVVGRFSSVWAGPDMSMEIKNVFENVPKPGSGVVLANMSRCKQFGDRALGLIHTALRNSRAGDCDMVDELHVLMGRASTKEFSWVSDIARLCGGHPFDALAHIVCMKSYILFQCFRCFMIAKNAEISCGPDFAVLCYLLRDIMGNGLDKKRMRSQIDDILASDICNEMAVVMGCAKIVSASLALIDVRKIVRDIDIDFCEFGLSSEIPLEKLLSSGAFDEAKMAREAVFELIWKDDATCKNLPERAVVPARKLRSLRDAALIFESIDAFSQKEDVACIRSSEILRLRVIALAIELRIDKLYTGSPETFGPLYNGFRKAVSSLVPLSDRFGYVEANLTSFRNEWISFCGSIAPVSMREYYDSFRQNAKLIVNGLQSSGEDATVRVIEAQTCLFDVLRDPDHVLTLQLMFLLCESRESEMASLQFADLQAALKSILAFNEVCFLVARMSEFLETDGGITESLAVDEFEANDTHALSFADQTALAQMVHAYIDANQRDQEALAELPVIRCEIEGMKPAIEMLNEENERLFEANSILLSVARAMGEGKSVSQAVSPHDLAIVRRYVNQASNAADICRTAERMAKRLFHVVRKTKGADGTVYADICESDVVINHEYERREMSEYVRAVEMLRGDRTAFDHVGESDALARVAMSREVRDFHVSEATRAREEMASIEALRGLPAEEQEKVRQSILGKRARIADVARSCIEIIDS